MNSFKKMINKFTDIVSPLWTLVSILAAIVYLSWIVAAWCFKQSANDEQLFASDIKMDSRITAVENMSEECHDNMIEIKGQLKQINGVLGRLEGKKNEMVY